jgi:hypothetical protein
VLGVEVREAVVLVVGDGQRDRLFLGGRHVPSGRVVEGASPLGGSADVESHLLGADLIHRLGLVLSGQELPDVVELVHRRLTSTQMVGGVGGGGQRRRSRDGTGGPLGPW